MAYCVQHSFWDILLLILNQIKLTLEVSQLFFWEMLLKVVNHVFDCLIVLKKGFVNEPNIILNILTWRFIRLSYNNNKKIKIFLAVVAMLVNYG